MKILVAEHQQKIRQALRLLLEEELGALVAEAASAEQLFSRLAAHQPNILLLSIKVAGGEISRLLEDIRAEAVDLQVIVLVSNKAEASAALAAGADGVFEKTDSPGKLAGLIKTIAGGNDPQTKPPRLPKDHWRLTKKNLIDGKRD